MRTCTRSRRERGGRHWRRRSDAPAGRSPRL
jgi:hypothetical protein